MPKPRTVTEPNHTDAIVEWLRRPSAYPGHPEQVTVRETHMAWVFLTDTLAYKLKKPVRFSYLDYSTVAARKAICAAEVALNRRLSPWVYLGTVPVLRNETGDFRLGEDEGGSGEPVDWLVKMHRLPAEGFLETAIESDVLDPTALDAAAGLLARFYAGQPPVRPDPAAYAKHLLDDVSESREALEAAPDILPVDTVGQIGRVMARFVSDESALLGDRATRVVEGHGDLRPEHIHLGPPPAVIDCIEFKRDFRLNDPADELAFLGMECTRLGATWVGPRFLEVYRDLAEDAPQERLIAFYSAKRALLRAKLSLWHLEDHVPNPEKWRRKARTYLELAEKAVCDL